SANPLEKAPLRVANEEREIKHISLASAGKSRRIELDVCPAAQPSDLQAELLRVRPTIVHVACHARGRAGIILHDGSGGYQHVDWGMLETIFRVVADSLRVRCLILNGCGTAKACPKISKFVDMVIGWKGDVADEAAIAFARGFYANVAEGG